MQNIKIPSYREPSLLSLVLLTFLGAMGCMLLGYIVLPFAAAFYAALIFTEKKSKFLFSYLIPIFSVAINFLLNGPYSLEGVSFAAVGFSDTTTYFAFVETEGELADHTSANEKIVPGFFTKDEVIKLLETEEFSSRSQMAAYYFSLGMRP